MKRVAFVLLFILSCSLGIISVKAENDVTVYNYQNDLASYARTVAELNRVQNTTGYGSKSQNNSRNGHALYTLLCKTDGRDIDFLPFSPTYIVAGPKNSFTLFFLSEVLCRQTVTQLNITEGIVFAELDTEVFANGELGDDVQEPPGYVFKSYGAEQMRFAPYINYVEKYGVQNTTVAVIDSGVFPHKLISPKLMPSGYDYVDGDNDSSNDLFGHGTNVAGIIADCTADMAVRLYSIRVLDSNGRGKLSNVVNAVREAVSEGVDVINLSLESYVMSEALDDAILEAVSDGTIVVVAAGNSACDTSEVCPAHLTNNGVLVVGSVEGTMDSCYRASYSNYGASVDVYAFGTNVVCCSRSGGYTNATGTSISAPHMSAICALMHLIHPELSPGQVENRIKRAAITGSPITVPLFSMMVPETEGFFLSDVKMSLGEQLKLPTYAQPLSSCEAIAYCSSDESIINYTSGSLNAIGVGTATITAVCKGFDEMTFQVVVREEQEEVVLLPNAMKHIDAEAFLGASAISSVIIPDGTQCLGSRAFDACTSLKWIGVPPSVIDIGENLFSNAVILCRQGSYVYQYVLDNDLQYICQND